jgi:hypothetical protein
MERTGYVIHQCPQFVIRTKRPPNAGHLVLPSPWALNAISLHCRLGMVLIPTHHIALHGHCGCMMRDHTIDKISAAGDGVCNRNIASLHTGLLAHALRTSRWGETPTVVACRIKRPRSSPGLKKIASLPFSPQPSGRYRPFSEDSSARPASSHKSYAGVWHSTDCERDFQVPGHLGREIIGPAYCLCGMIDQLDSVP